MQYKIMIIQNNTCEILVVRHGQTQANKQGIFQGQLDTQLDDLGILQAKAIAQRLKNIHIDILYSSDLSRTMITAQEIVSFHNELTIIPTPDLREWNLGILQGQLINDVKNNTPHLLAIIKNEIPDATIPNGESVKEFHTRIINFLTKVANDNLGKRVLLVTHGGAIQRMLIHTFGILSQSNIRPSCDNVSISSFKFTSGKWQLICWNDTAHLENLTTTQTIAL